MRPTSILLLVSALLSGAAFAALDDAPARAEGPAVEVRVPTFGNETCPVMNKPVKADKFAEKDGERIYTCCSKCVAKVLNDFDAFKAEAYPADAVKKLENPKCPVMGKTAKEDVVTVFQGHEIRFCCKGCDTKFKKDPRRHLALLTEPGLVALGNEKCLVMPEDAVEAGHFFIYRNTLIDSCCSDCAEEFQADPEKFLKAAGVTLDADGRPVKPERGEKDEG